MLIFVNNYNTDTIKPFHIIHRMLSSEDSREPFIGKMLSTVDNTTCIPLGTVEFKSRVQNKCILHDKTKKTNKTKQYIVVKPHL